MLPNSLHETTIGVIGIMEVITTLHSLNSTVDDSLTIILSKSTPANIRLSIPCKWQSTRLNTPTHPSLVTHFKAEILSMRLF